ncbi:MAG: ATP-binding cassette domain-containing protein [Pseudomonadota bacterium]
MPGVLDGAAPPALSVAGVAHHYGRTVALDDVTLAVRPGTFTVLLGVNGAGKTTLFSLITRLFATQQGAISICGASLSETPSQALRSLGVVFQSRALDANLTVAQNMIYQGALYGIGRRTSLARGLALLDQIGLADRIDHKVGRLSGGQQRRVEIARALLHEPRLILCDEATVGLDVKSRTDIVATLHRLAAETGIGVLWTTHLIDEIEPDDPVYLLHKGRVCAHGSAAEIAQAHGAGGSLSDAFLALTRADQAGATGAA